MLTDWMAGRLIRQGYVQKLDKANIPNAKNLEREAAGRRLRPRPRALDDLAERLRRHRLPQGQGRPRAEDRSSDLWAPDLKGKIIVLSEMRDTVGLIMMAQGVDISRTSARTTSTKGLDELQKQVDSGQIRQVKGNSYLEDLRSGNAIACIALVRRHPARPVRGGGRQLHVHHAGVRRHAVVGQPDGPDRVAAQDERREADRLLLRPGGRGRGRGLRQLHLPGRRRQGGDGEDRPLAGRQPADLPDRGGPGQRQGVPQPERRTRRRPTPSSSSR